MPTPRAWSNPFAPATPPALAWPAWLAFAALVMAVGLVELVADSVRGAWLAARTRASVALIEAGMRVGPRPPMREGARRDPAWRVVMCPKGSAAVMSGRKPGPEIGQPGQLERWQDAGGEEWAGRNGIPVDPHPVTPEEWRPPHLGGRVDYSAGPRRNARMAAVADAVVLFPGDKGTRSMLREAAAAGLVIHDWRGE